MLNGKYDFFFPQRPALANVPAARDSAGSKRYVLDEGSHFVPRTLLIQETLLVGQVPTGEVARESGVLTGSDSERCPALDYRYDKLFSG